MIDEFHRLSAEQHRRGDYLETANNCRYDSPRERSNAADNFMIFATEKWPDTVDAALTGMFLLGVLGIAVLGYVFMVLDYRAYVRSLRRALVRVINYLPNVPEWAKVETPRCVAAFGLRMPCCQQDLMRAYRTKVKKLHPDRGGDKKRFLILQQNFEEAIEYLAEFERSTTITNH